MSLPNFSNETITRDNAINQIISSIAMEEVAISHILTAESEKIKFTLEKMKHGSCDIDLLLKVNESAKDLIETIVDLQIILKNKLKIATNYVQVPPCPPPPKPPCPPPKPPCPPPPKPPCPPPKPPCPQVLILYKRV